MSLKLRRILVSLVGFLLVLSIVIGTLAYFMPRRSFPKVSGELQLDGLDDAVDIFRDNYGIPHIYATNSHDLFFAQGYVHAQDRFWQMDFWRHIGSARLAEMFGEDQVDTDRFLRTLGWERIAQEELRLSTPEEQAVLQAYADGVNAYLADHSGAALSLEYAILKLLTPDYTPEPWQPVHTLTWAKVMAWDLGSGCMYSEIEHALLQKIITPQQLSDLYPPYPADHVVVVPGFNPLGTAGSAQPEATQTLSDTLTPAFQQLAHQLDTVETVLGPISRSIGSNNWVISGERTATGMPLLADDMHLSEQIPAIWYEVGLHCMPKGSDCPYEVTGYSFAGVPGVIVGHTDRIAWGFTNVGPDVLDLYIEKINPANSNQYEVNGQWVDMQIIQETIQVAGGDAVTLTVRATRHGPLIFDTAADNIEIQELWGIELPEQFGIAMRWTALEPNRVISAVLGYNSAQNWVEFRQAATQFAVPSQNTVYADVDGNIAYQTPGNIPIRLPGHDGTLPVPGWSDDYEWQGYIPFADLPNAFNPPQGYIVSANNAVVDAYYPYLLTMEWDYGFRASRIVELIETAPAPITVEYIQLMHGDNYNQSAADMVPFLLQLEFSDNKLIAARELLRDWDYQDHMDSSAAALYNAFWRALLAHTFQDDLPEEFWPGGDDRWFEIMRQFIQQPDSIWWDDQNTTANERRDDIFRLAFEQAVTELSSLLGSQSVEWLWGDLHGTIFHHQTLGLSGVAPIEAIFNRGPYPTSGGASIVNATSWVASTPDAATAYQVTWLPSMRMIADLSNLSASLSVNTTGQSGHAFHPHYTDQADLWRNIQYHPMLWDRQTIESNAEGYLRLLPGR